MTAGQVVGAIKTDRKPRVRKTMTEQIADLEAQADKVQAAIARAEKKYDRIVAKRLALIAEAKAVTEGAQP